MVIKRMIRVVFFLVLVVGLLTAGCYSRGQILPEFDKTFTNSIGMRFMSIPAGSFEMGNSDPGIQDWDEAPVHGVSISAGFYMSETEVTLEQYRQFRPDFSGSMLEYPAVVGLSWDDAAAFCEWLSDKEGIVYRLPTEAEWEYACRAGTSTPYWSGAEPPEQGVPNPWGLKHMHSGPREWCYDWYGPYPHGAQINPVGPAEGFARVIRGGGDEARAYYGRSFNRSGYGPGFRRIVKASEMIQPKRPNEDEMLPGLAGLWYGRLNFERVRGFEILKSSDVDFKAQGRVSNTWAGRFSGYLVAPLTGDITFYLYSDGGAIFEISGDTLVSWRGEAGERSGTMSLVEGEFYPVTVSYYHEYGDESVLRIRWSWAGRKTVLIPEANLKHTWKQEIARKEITDAALGLFKPIGFRVVQASMPSTEPMARQKPFAQQCVVQDQPMWLQGSSLQKPWFRKRLLLPIPPDNVPREQTRLAGFSPGMMGHNHSPTMEVCPNGDLLFISYTSQREYEPEVSFLITRLRFGAAEWDMPEIFFDFPDANDHAPCLYTEDRKMFFFFGTPAMGGATPFQWMTSEDNGASWSETRFPVFSGEVGPLSRQPINTVFRDLEGILYVPNDAEGQTSVLFGTKDDGETWFDTGGRSAGRHTTYTLLTDGRILGMGGKNTDIDGYMPKAISSDGGRSWEVSKTPFAALGGNQRPCIVRLKSGRLFFCGDFQAKDGSKPDGITQSGSYVALSEDEGETWIIKKLVSTLPHETDLKAHTLGYSVARQAPNGIIHITTSMNTPCLHFEINEAWILSDDAGFQEVLDSDVKDVQTFREFYRSGDLKGVWSAGVAAGMEVVLHGSQAWYYEDGSRQYVVTYTAGHKVGEETLWDTEGRRSWTWQHGDDGSSVWTQFYANGQKKSESTWKFFTADGPARRWTRDSVLISDVIFKSGKIE